MALASVSSVYTQRMSLEQMEGAISIEPWPEDSAAGTYLGSLGFLRWKPGGPGSCSIKTNSNYRAHLRRDQASGSCIAEPIGNHK
jgi:hypothetical protein